MCVLSEWRLLLRRLVRLDGEHQFANQTNEGHRRRNEGEHCLGDAFERVEDRSSGNYWCDGELVDALPPRIRRSGSPDWGDVSP